MRLSEKKIIFEKLIKLDDQPAVHAEIKKLKSKKS